jgi:type IX secretion system PorP/SprF family membrane protein
MQGTQFKINIAYHALLNTNNTLSGGFAGGVVQRSISPDGLRWNSQYPGGVFDPNLASGENFSTQSFAHADLSLGILWSYGEGGKYLTANDHKHVHAGISIDHLNKPAQSFLNITPDKLNWKVTTHAGSLFGIKNTNYSIGASLLHTKQGPLHEATAGAVIKYKFKENSVYTGFIKSSALTLGCYYRNNDAVIPYVMYEMDKYSIGISYDTTISGLTAVNSGRGGIEISLRFNAPSPFLYQTKSRF